MSILYNSILYNVATWGNESTSVYDINYDHCTIIVYSTTLRLQN